MDDDSPDDKKSAPKKPGDMRSGQAKIIPFPHGNSILPEDIGVSYVAGTAVPSDVSILPDPNEIDKKTRERYEYIKRQELLQAIESDAPSSVLLKILMRETAEELAHIKYERRQATLTGGNVAGLSKSRFEALGKLFDLIVRRQDSARAERVDLSSPWFQEIMKSWMEFVYESMHRAGLAEREMNLVFNQIKTDMTEWEKTILTINR